MFIIKHKNIFIGISAALVALSIASIAVFKLRLGIEFTGGALTEISYAETVPAPAEIRMLVAPLGLGELVVQPAGDSGYILRTRDLTEAERADLFFALAEGSGAEEESFTSIGPSVGRELARKAIISMLLVALGIVLYLAYAFRHVSKPVSSWKYGFIAVAALVHDIVVPAGIFAFISSRTGAQIDTLFVLALLTILGLSVSDTIVIFDRVRENLKADTGSPFPETVGKSLSQSFSRSINTSLTTILMLVALYAFGPASTKNFALVLGIGLIVGTYSSLFLASPLLVLTEKIQKKNEQ